MGKTDKMDKMDKTDKMDKMEPMVLLAQPKRPMAVFASLVRMAQHHLLPMALTEMMDAPAEPNPQMAVLVKL